MFFDMTQSWRFPKTVEGETKDFQTKGGNVGKK